MPVNPVWGVLGAEIGGKDDELYAVGQRKIHCVFSTWPSHHHGKNQVETNHA